MHQINLTITEDTAIIVNGTITLEVLTRNDQPVVVITRSDGQTYVLQDYRNIFIKDSAGNLQPATE